jgi:hypothetical protein
MSATAEFDRAVKESPFAGRWTHPCTTPGGEGGLRWVVVDIHPTRGGLGFWEVLVIVGVGVEVKNFW